MAVNMTFYSGFSKRDNSTKQPSGGTDYTVVFKEEFSIIGGTVKLQVNFDTAKNYTAAKYGSNFYKVVDIISTTNNIVEITLSLDVLATYKSSIASYTGLIERAPVDSYINYLPDDKISNTGNMITNKLIWSSDLILSKQNVCVQIKTSNSVSAQCYYTSIQGLVNLTNKLDDLWAGNDIRLITEINFVNISLASIGLAAGAVSTNDIIIGNVSYNVEDTVYAFYQPSVVEETHVYNLLGVEFNYSDARKIDDRYTRISFIVNNTEVVLDSVYNVSSELKVDCTLDLNTLSVLTQISVKRYDSYKILYSGYTNVGIGYSLSNNNANTLKGISTAFRVSGQALLKNYSGFINEIPNIVQNKEASCSGSAPGTVLSITDLFFKLYLIEYDSTDKSPGEYGYPYYKVSSINTLNTSGFYKFVNPKLNIASLEGVRSQVDTYLSNGFFYE